MGSYRSDNQTPNNPSADGTMPVRTCPTCRKEYPLDVQVCPADGAQLPYALPVEGGFDETLIVEGQEYGVKRLEGAVKDHMRRSVCPNCGAWKNWTSEGVHYFCVNCGAHYLYKGDDIFRVLGKIEEQGNLVPEVDADGSEKAQAKLEESPFYNLLTEIDESNKEHWIKKFKHFKEGQFNESWNWPSFFIGPMRYFFKGMSGRGALYLFAGIALYAVIGAIFGPQDLESNPLYRLIGGLVNVVFAAMGSNDYFRFCLKYKDNIKGARRARIIGKINIVLFAVVWLALTIL